MNIDSVSSVPLQAFLEDAPVIFWATDLHGTYTMSQGQGLEVLGLKQNELVGKNHFQFNWNVPDSIESVNRALNGEKFSRDALISGRWFSTNYSPVIRENSIVGMKAISIDITEKVNQAKEEAEKVSLITNAVPGFMSYVDLELRYQYVNEAYVEWFGSSREQILNRTLQEVLGPTVYARAEEYAKSALNGVRSQYTTTLRSKDGFHIHLKVDYIPDFDDSGAVRGFVIMGNDVTALKDSEDRLQLALESAQMGTWEINLKTTESILSPQFKRIFGVAVDEDVDIAKLIDRVVHPADLEAVKQVVIDAVETKTFYTHEYRILNPKGEIRWLLSNGRAVYDNEGGAEVISGIILDVTDQKVFRQELREKENEIVDLVNSMPQLAWMANAEGFIYWYNEKWFEYTGTTFEQMLGWGWKAVHDPKVLPNVLTLWQRSIAEGTPFELEFPLRSRNGDFRWFLTQVVPLKDSDGKVYKWFGTNTDIDVQIRTSQKLRESERRSQAIVHNMEEGLVLANGQGEDLYFNPAALKLHGFRSREEVISALDEYPQLFTALTLEGVELSLEQWPISKILAGETFSEYEVQVRRSDTGKSFIASYSGSPMYDDDHNIIMAVMTLRDVTYRIKTEIDLKNAVISRDEFLSIASHELKTPLTSLKLQTQSFNRKLSKGMTVDLSQEKLSILFSKNLIQIDRLIRLVDDMLDLSRIESGKLTYNFAMVDLKEMIEDLCERFREHFESMSCRMTTQLQEVSAFVDRERIEQVVTNLITNALKYGNKQPVETELSVSGAEAIIRVRDHGIGISQENFDKVFQRFERIISPSEVSGLGLGLFITKQIVEEHGGSITVESLPGIGSTFTVSIPLQLHRPPEHSEPAGGL